MTPINKFTSLVNAAIRRKQVSVIVPASTTVEGILRILVAEQFIRSYSRVANKFNFEVNLAYKDGQPVLKEIVNISKPGRRVYAKHHMLMNYQFKTLGRSRSQFLQRSRFSRLIVLTSQGIMLEDTAITKKLGGEVLCRIIA